MTSEIYKPPDSDVPGDDTGNRKLGVVLIIFTVLIFLTNAFFSFVVASVQYKGDADIYAAFMIAEVTIEAVCIPLLFVGFFQIWKRFRNEKSRTKIFMWASILGLLSNFGHLLTFVEQIKR